MRLQSSAYYRLYAYDAGLRIAGPVREVYLRFGADQDSYVLPPAMLARGVYDYDTELQIPITRV